NAAVVAVVEDNSPARGKITAGEVFDGIKLADKVQRFVSSRQAYEELSRVKPRQTVAIRVGAVDDGQRARYVSLVVGQGVDERKPLFSFFLARPANAAKPADRDWIGWSPHGPYESSGPRAERLLGWHFNTGKPDAPAAFAPAERYHKQYHREGILRHLVAR